MTLDGHLFMLIHVGVFIILNCWIETFKLHISSHWLNHFRVHGTEFALHHLIINSQKNIDNLNKQELGFKFLFLEVLHYKKESVLIFNIFLFFQFQAVDKHEQKTRLVWGIFNFHTFSTTGTCFKYHSVWSNMDTTEVARFTIVLSRMV